MDGYAYTGIPIRCVLFTTPRSVCEKMNEQRAATSDRDLIPRVCSFTHTLIIIYDCLTHIHVFHSWAV
jgi:hypothetical protein